ncbi:MAG: DNA-3-methyladenine glycosylase 2 family protein [Candidatus Chisholmbacteria bacterium]|nr:DNA-3-methyladenine glycosylase 2 family protein [Candidatus Chisholmbacteria bacterium]
MNNHLVIKHHFRKIDPIIYSVMKDLDFSDWLKPRVAKRTARGYFAALCREIIGQQLSGKVADIILTRFKGLSKSKIIKPQDVLKLSDQKLRDVGMSWAKVKYVKDLALQISSRSLNLHTVPYLSDEEVVHKLTQVKGIGRWTAEMFLIFTLGREDVFSFGDLGLKKGLQKLYKLKKVTEKNVHKIIAPWSPYKSYGSIALWHSLES